MSIQLIKKLGLMPPNELTPIKLSEHFQHREFAWTSKEKLAGLYAVGRSTGWLGYSKVGKGTNGANIAIVGKGITFDSGGISIKPSRDMHGMKMDMLGAATVLALAKSLDKLDGTFHLFGCCAENTFHHDQMRPGDVVTYTKGITGLAYEVVINTNPCIAYLMENNTATLQALVLAHASCGHSSFFKNNYLFKTWTEADSILDYLKFAKKYIRSCEEKYGEKACVLPDLNENEDDNPYHNNSLLDNQNDGINEDQ